MTDKTHAAAVHATPPAAVVAGTKTVLEPAEPAAADADADEGLAEDEEDDEGEDTVAQNAKSDWAAGIMCSVAYASRRRLKKNPAAASSWRSSEPMA